MIEDWMNYFWQLFFRFLYLPTKAVEGNSQTKEEKIVKLAHPVKENKTASTKMSNMQVAVADTNTACVANKEVESECTEETTLTEIHKNLGNTQISEKKAEFESNETTSLVEDHRTKQTESNKSVVQSESVEVSSNRKVISSSFETSQSFSMEETEEYEVEG